MKKTVPIFYWLLLVAALCVSTSARAEQIPGIHAASCTTDCISPYGAVLGSTADGTPAYSNCKADCVVFEPNQVNSTYTGIKWQCVEFARRWLVGNAGLTFGDVDTAADIWGKIAYFTRLADGAQIGAINHLNGSTAAPQKGDLLIYAREYLGTGHVAVVVAVDEPNEQIVVAEQNFENRKWHGDHARKIGFIEKNGRYWLLDSYILGWKRPQ